nr:PREDICTED: LOW QUALITY PROTEIN: leucine-rich repeat-containing protein egg-6-like [Linepithema humile]
MASLNFSNTVISHIGPYFISSPLITCLNLTNNRIQYVAKNAFKNLPNLTYLSLSKNNFENSATLFNFGGHEKLKILVLNDATNNKYPELKVKIFENYPYLEILYARNNGFRDMEYSLKNPIPFQYTIRNIYHKKYFPKLKVLDLSENKMQYTSFVNLLSNSLQFLDLHGNNLNSLNLGEKGENLVMLDLDNNEFDKVAYTKSYDSSLTLANLKNLSYLSISRNRIEIIYSTAFQDTDKLSYLNLSMNNINEVPADTFAKLHSLSTLDLSSNILKNIPQMSGKINISVLFLNCNKIQKIIPNAFAQTPKLTKLSLEDNEIDEIDAKAFAHLSVLEELDFSGNKLNSLPEGWSESLISLKYLDLSNNMFTSLESLSLTSALPLMELYLTNSLDYLNVKYFENLPQNLAVNFLQSLNFTQALCKYKYDYNYY